MALTTQLQKPNGKAASSLTGKETKPMLRTELPGPRSQAIVARDGAALATTTKTAPVTAVRGKGVVVEDADGNVLLDFCAGIGVLNTGHSHPAVVKAIQDQAARRSCGSSIAQGIEGVSHVPSR